jgi:membrane fusion protein, multidrug efflux system
MSTLHRSILLLACLPLVACNRDEHQNAQVPRPVLTTTVTSSLDKGSGFAGTVEARYQTARGFQVLGRIESFNVDVGDTVARGQRLAALDPTSFRLDVNSKIGDVARAEARLKNASSQMERTRRLVSSGSSTQAQLDADIQAHAAARAGLDQANAELDKARTRVDYTVLTSDEDGVVVDKAADVGRTVNAGQPVMTIARTDVRDVVVDVPDAVSSSLTAGIPFEVRLQADPGITAMGRIREIAPQADDATRTRRLKVTLERPPEAFRLGATVTAEPIRVVDRTLALSIPRGALVGEAGRATVWVVDPQDRTVHATRVRTGPAGAHDVPVLDGLSAGQIIIVAGQSDLKDGQTVAFDGEKGQ